MLHFAPDSVKLVDDCDDKETPENRHGHLELTCFWPKRQFRRSEAEINQCTDSIATVITEPLAYNSGFPDAYMYRQCWKKYIVSL